MKRRPGISPVRADKRSTIASLALTAIAFAAITGGCVKDHDPRNDSSRLDAQPRSVPAISIDHVHA
jgi:hypothetical protein